MAFFHGPTPHAAQSEICAVRARQKTVKRVMAGSTPPLRDTAKPGRPIRHTASIQASPETLTFGELEPLASALLAVLLALVLARVAGEIAELLQPRTQFRIEFHQGPGNTQAAGAGLADHAPAAGENQHGELIRALGGRQRLPHHGARTLRREVILERTAVHRNLALAGP